MVWNINANLHEYLKILQFVNVWLRLFCYNDFVLEIVCSFLLELKGDQYVG